MPQTFGTWLAYMRERAGLSQRQLAHKMGVVPATISKIEDDNVGISRKNVKAAATALEVPLSEAVAAWLADDTQEGGALEYIEDPDMAIIAQAYRGMPPSVRRVVKGQVLSAAEIARAIDDEETLGSRADSDVNKSRRADD